MLERIAENKDLVLIRKIGRSTPDELRVYFEENLGPGHSALSAEVDKTSIRLKRVGNREFAHI